ncbi:hypothetical protein T03_13743 [Trichinella britovi]|uniref:Uncharacterized protein n=1 Tax=Trichinella britovi TaxID=45882 RepID=A0A0V1C7F1_TRIBR|nr:hypothetical protein T03_13743 [Trichinella britovi]
MCHSLQNFENVITIAAVVPSGPQATDVSGPFLFCTIGVPITDCHATVLCRVPWVILHRKACFPNENKNSTCYKATERRQPVDPNLHATADTRHRRRKVKQEQCQYNERFTAVTGRVLSEIF